MPSFYLPAAFLFVANFCNSISLDRIGISLTYTSKCGIPLITVLLTVLLDGPSALPPMAALLALIPIAVGIAAASWNSPTFEKIGFAAAVVSASAQASLNVGSKRVMNRTGLGGADAQRAMVAVALCITVGMSLLGEMMKMLHLKYIATPRIFEGEKEGVMTHEEGMVLVQGKPPVWLAWMAVISYHVEYVLSFTFVGLVEPITYGTCDAVRRLSIIIAGHKMFGGAPFSKLNLGGIGLALAGALAYSVFSTIPK